MPHFAKSLRFKVTLLVIGVELLIFTGVGVFYTHRFSQEVDNAIVARLSIPGLLMTRGELDFGAVSDKRTMEGLLHEPYREGFVIGLDGYVYYSSDPARLDTHLETIDGLRLPGADTPDLITPLKNSTGNYLTSLYPLRPDGKLTGDLYLKIGTALSEAEKNKISILFAIGLLGTIVLTVPTLSWLLNLMVFENSPVSIWEEDFSRTGRMALVPVEIDMDKLVREVMEELKPAITMREIKLEIDSLPTLYADRPMLRRVFVNLLSNAIKFSRTQATPHIKVGATCEADETIYFVQDNGVGFDMRYADKLFGVFQRLHNVNEFEGAGIGLAIVKRVVSRLGGRVWDDGKVGEGATVSFSLPGKGGG